MADWRKIISITRCPLFLAGDTGKIRAVEDNEPVIDFSQPGALPSILSRSMLWTWRITTVRWSALCSMWSTTWSAWGITA